MRQRIHAIAVVLEVQQDKWRCAISTTAIGTAAFSWCLVDIDPTLGKCLLENTDVVFTKWSECVNDYITRLLVADFIVFLFHYRHIQIIHMQFVELEDTFAQLQIAIE